MPVLALAVWTVACAPARPAPTTPPGREANERSTDCGGRGAVALQVLGSGGPIADDARASAGYLVWVDGRARALVDAGGGTFARFGEAGADIGDLDVVALSHLHADHAAALPALLKSGYFARRRRALPIVGPTGSDRFPSVEAFLEALLDSETGAFRYLSGYLSGDGRLFPVDARVVDAARETPIAVYAGERSTLEAVGVHHGVIPALGFRLTVAGRVIAFGGDQSARTDGFAALARDADLLVMHHAVPEGGAGVAHLHRTPSQIGALAAEARPARLVLSHHMRRALDRLSEGLEAIGARYGGPVEVAGDLDCFVMDAPDGGASAR